MPSAELVTNLKTIIDNYKNCKLEEAGAQCEPNLSLSLSLSLSLTHTHSLSLSHSLTHDVYVIRWCDGASWVADRRPVDKRP